MAAVTKSDASRVLPVHKMRVGVGVAGKFYRELTGASLVDHTSGSRSVTQTPTFRGPGVSTGAKSIEPVTFNLAAVQPHIAAMVDLDRADRQRQLVNVRMDIYSRVIQAVPSGATPTIAVAVPTANNAEAAAKGGEITIAGDGTGGVNYANMFLSDTIMVGDVIDYTAARTSATAVADAMAYVVNRIEVDDETGALGDIFVTAHDGGDAAMHAAGKATIRTGGWRMEFTGEIEQFGSISGDASGAPSLSSGVMFRPQSLLPRSQLILVDEGNAGW